MKLSEFHPSPKFYLVRPIEVEEKTSGEIHLKFDFGKVAKGRIVEPSGQEKHIVLFPENMALGMLLEVEKDGVISMQQFAAVPVDFVLGGYHPRKEPGK